MFKTNTKNKKKISSKIAQSKRVISSLQATHLTSPMRILKKKITIERFRNKFTQQQDTLQLEED